MKYLIFSLSILILSTSYIFSQNNLYLELSRLQSDKKYDEAIKLLDKVILIKPNVAKRYIQRAEFYLRLNKLENAIEDIDKALQLEPNNAYHHFKRADYFALKGDQNSWFNEFDLALSKAPKGDFSIRHRIAKIYFRSDLYEKSLETIEHFAVET